MEKDYDKLKLLLNSNSTRNRDLGLILMQSVGLPMGINWSHRHLNGLDKWLTSLMSGKLTAKDLEEKEISYTDLRRSYKIRFYETSIEIKELCFCKCWTPDKLDNILPLLKNIQHLTLKRSFIFTTIDTVFQFKHLLTLKLEWFNWSKLILEITQLTQLKELSLKNCSITKLPQDIGNLQNLELLDVRRNKIRKIPLSFWTLKQLKTLYIGDVITWEEPSKDTVLESLETLELNGTLQIPDWIWSKFPNLKKLVWIKTSTSSMIALSSKIGTLSKLEHLILEVRTLKYPSVIGNLIQLKQLEIYNDVLSSAITLPAEWAQLSNLQVLKLRGIFDELPIEWVAMTELKEFSCNNKAKKVVPLIYELTNLQLLRLFLNEGAIIDDKIRNLARLKRLVLRGNLNSYKAFVELSSQKRKAKQLLPNTAVDK